MHEQFCLFWANSIHRPKIWPNTRKNLTKTSREHVQTHVTDRSQRETEMCTKQMVAVRPPVRFGSLALHASYSLRRCVRCALLPHWPQSLHLCVRVEGDREKANALECTVGRSLALSRALTLHRFVYSGDVNGTGLRFDAACGIPSESGSAETHTAPYIVMFCRHNGCLRGLSAYASWSFDACSIVCTPVDTFFPSLCDIARTL